MANRRSKSAQPRPARRPAPRDAAPSSGARGKKTAAKTAAPEKIEQPHGGAILTGGVPGNRGGGRPSNSLREALEELRRDPAALAALKRAASSPSSKGFATAWRLAMQYDPEKPSDRVEHEVGETLEQVLTRMASGDAAPSGVNHGKQRPTS